MADMTARTKSGWSASRANLAARLVCERLTGTPQETYTNAAMQHGTETEPLARQMYEFMRDVSVEQVGLVLHPSIVKSHASPDGLIGDNGLLEIKCPNTATHLETLLSEEIDGKYIKQMQWQLGVCEREWCDFASFDPRLPAELQLWVKRVYRDDAMIAELEKEARVFLAEIDATIAELTAKYMPAAIAAE
jgi:putative phage-type endonuclease